MYQAKLYDWAMLNNNPIQGSLQKVPRAQIFKTEPQGLPSIGPKEGGSSWLYGLLMDKVLLWLSLTHHRLWLCTVLSTMKKILCKAVWILPGNIQGLWKEGEGYKKRLTLWGNIFLSGSLGICQAAEFHLSGFVVIVWKMQEKPIRQWNL